MFWNYNNMLTSLHMQYVCKFEIISCVHMMLKIYSNVSNEWWQNHTIIISPFTIWFFEMMEFKKSYNPFGICFSYDWIEKFCGWCQNFA